jgi:hypothetical protein
MQAMWDAALKKRIPVLLSLAVAFVSFGYNAERPNESVQRPALNGFGAPPHSHETTNLAATDQPLRKGSPRESLTAILDRSAFAAMPLRHSCILTPAPASGSTSSTPRFNSVRAPPPVLSF